MPNRADKRLDRAVQWSLRLAGWTAGALAFLAISGLLIWFAPFSEFIQVTVLAHTFVALVFLAPVSWYCVRHWLVYRNYPFTHVKLLGYLGVFVLFGCIVSGLVLTYQPLLGTRIGYVWRAVHQWTTVALVAFIVPHVVLILVREFRSRKHEAVAPVWRAARGYGKTALALPLVLLAAVGLLDYAYEPPAMMQEFAEGYELWEPRNPLYGKNRPFAPSLARTKENKPIDARLLSGSRGCGTSGCHEQIVKEWLPSAHRYSAMDKGFQAIQLTMAKQNGPTSTRYCGGCHDPISLFSGAKNIYSEDAGLTTARGYHEGVSCLSCHSVKETDVKGNAYYLVEPPPRYIGELEYDHSQSGAWRVTRDFLIRAYPDKHASSLSKVMFKKPEYCAACHKQFVDEEINKVGWVQLQNQYDNWRMSKWSRDLKGSERIVECRECHMPLVQSRDPAAGDPHDYNRTPGDGKHRSHRFIAANQLMPALLKLEGAEEQGRLTEQWLKGQFPIPEIEGKWPGVDVPAVSIQLIAPPKVRPGQKVTLKCVITSNKVGHDFPTGPLDIIQSWIELVVKDQDGKVVYQTGTVDEKGFIQSGSFLFKAEPVDQYGNLIDRHNLWEMVGVRQRRSLFPGFSDTVEFGLFCPGLDTEPRKRLPARNEFVLPTVREGKLLITAKLRYRKIDQFLLNFVRSVGFFPEFKGQHLTSPITDMHEQRAVIEVTRR